MAWIITRSFIRLFNISLSHCLSPSFFLRFVHLSCFVHYKINLGNLLLWHLTFPYHFRSFHSISSLNVYYKTHFFSTGPLFSSLFLDVTHSLFVIISTASLKFSRIMVISEFLHRCFWLVMCYN